MEATLLSTPSTAAAFSPIAARPSSRSWRRPALAIIALAAAGATWFGVTKLRQPDAPPAPVQAAASRGDIVSTVTATGTLSPVVQVQVGSQVSGRIQEVLVDYNSPVKKGQVLARLEPELFDSAITQARARLSSAGANLARAKAVAANARAQNTRMAALAAEGAISRAEADTALADKRSADAQVTAAAAEASLAQAELEQVRVNLTYTTITSPIDGVVITRSVDPGSTVAASLSAPVLFVIAGDLGKMVLHTAVAESDVGQLATGMRVDFTVDAFPERTFAGKVEQVRYEATVASNVVTYDAVVAVDNADLKLRPGMTANATFVTAERKDVLTVPNKALRYRPADAPARGEWRARRQQNGGGERRGNRERGEQGAGGAREGKRGMVWVIRGGKPTPIRIRTGLSDGNNTEVVVAGELKAGDQVIVSAAETAARTAATPAGADGARGGNGGSGGRRGGGRRGPAPVL